jgi:hypothetical protein
VIFNEDPKFWTGCHPSERHPRRTAVPRLSALPTATPTPLYCWYRYCLPALNQKGPSCVGQAWANWLECMVRRYVPVNRQKSLVGEFLGTYTSRWQIDGDRLWKQARKLFYSGDMTDGLALDEGAKALLRLGWIPGYADLVEVDPDWESIGVSLANTPLVQAHQVHQGWFEVDPHSGCINHLPNPQKTDGYHATLMIGRAMQREIQFRVSMNSWGFEWGNKGYFVMTDREDQDGAVGCPLTFSISPSKFATWEGWALGLRRADEESV